MEKNADIPPPYYPDNQGHQGLGYGQPQCPPGYSYNQNQGVQPQNPPVYNQQQQYQPAPGQQPYGQFHQPYPNVIIHQPMAVAPQGPPPPDHMTSAIFVTLCCFWPTGILAILKANEAKNAYMRGDSSAAITYARSAKNMVTVSIIAGICSMIIAAVFIGLYWGVLMSQYNYDDDGY